MKAVFAHNKNFILHLSLALEYKFPMSSPNSEYSFRQPAEWQKHRACWTAWPSHAELWQENLASAQAEFTALCHEIGQSENLEILVPNQEQHKLAEKALAGLPVRFHSIPFGDIWLRDTSAIFVKNPQGALSTVRFAFNGWGGKYILPHDSHVSARIAEACGLPQKRFDWVLEGGAIEPDGSGTCLTTRQCLLNSNRHSGQVPSEKEVENRLAQALGIHKVIWLDEGLANDHTDGHIDNLARFVAPSTVVCMRAETPDDPNRLVLEQIAERLSSSTDAQGQKLRVIRIPSPGKLLNEEGRVIPASFMNFYISNKTVIVPIYNSPFDEKAVAALAAIFPDRKVVGLPSISILSGGGSFHCITQQEPV